MEDPSQEFARGTSTMLTTVVFKFERTFIIQLLYTHYMFCDTPVCFISHFTIFPLILERLSNLFNKIKNLINIVVGEGGC